MNSNLIYSPETLNLGRNWWYVIPCDLEIWWMTLENKRASLLCYFKLCAAFGSHWWIQTGVTVRKRPIWVNSISLLYDGRRFIDAIFKCIPSVKSFVFWVRIMNDVCSRGTIFCKSTLVWKKANHRFGDKPLSKRVLTKLTVTNMSCAWRRPFWPGQKKIIKI